MTCRPTRTCVISILSWLLLSCALAAQARALEVLRREELAHYLRSISPDLGPAECSLRAMKELRRVLRLRGVALVFRDGSAHCSI